MISVLGLTRPTQRNKYEMINDPKTSVGFSSKCYTAIDMDPMIKLMNAWMNERPKRTSVEFSNGCYTAIKEHQWDLAMDATQQLKNVCGI